MKIKVYVIDFETPRWVRKTLAYVVPAIVVLGVAAVVIAAPVQWGASETLTQAKMNAITVVTNGSVSYSVGATKYCGTGPSPTTGAISYNTLTGYAGAKAMCQASTGCGPSLTAHMCTSDEILRSRMVGISVPTSAWYATGVGVPVSGGQIYDCAAYTSAAAFGASWAGDPDYAACTTSQPILCCD